MLRVEIHDLQRGFDVGLIGFSADEIAALTFDKNAGLTDPDEAPDALAATVSEFGDIWLLGRHRLVCGDCTDPLVVSNALNGVKPHLMVTDPPYGVEYDAAWRGHVRTATGKRLSLGVHAKGKVENDGKADWREAWVQFAGDVALRAQIIWAKNNFAISRGHYHFQHEPCWYAIGRIAPPCVPGVLALCREGKKEGHVLALGRIEPIGDGVRAFALSLHPDKTLLIEFGRFAARARKNALTYFLDGCSAGGSSPGAASFPPVMPDSPRRYIESVAV